MDCINLVKLSDINVRKFESVKKEFSENHENQRLTNKLKQYNLDNLKSTFTDIFRLNGVNLNQFKQKQHAINLAIKVIQTNMNHNSDPYFNNKNICNELTEKDAIELFNGIINGTQRCKNGAFIKNEIEFICTHRNTFITNRKFSFSFFETNYTKTADNLREFVHNIQIAESSSYIGPQQEVRIAKNKFLYNSVTKKIRKNRCSDLKNLSVINNYGDRRIHAQSNLWKVQMEKVQSIVQNDITRQNREFTSGKWMIKIELNKINDVWKKVQKAIISGCLSKAQCYLVKGNEIIIKHKLMIYVPDYQDKGFVLETYKTLVRLNIIHKNEDINFVADRRVYKDYIEKSLFKYSEIDQYYEKLANERHLKEDLSLTNFVSPYDDLPAEIGNFPSMEEPVLKPIFSPKRPEKIVYRYI